jgi:hypothetical protein
LVRSQELGFGVSACRRETVNGELRVANSEPENPNPELETPNSNGERRTEFRSQETRRYADTPTRVYPSAFVAMCGPRFSVPHFNLASQLRALVREISRLVLCSGD